MAIFHAQVRRFTIVREVIILQVAATTSQDHQAPQTAIITAGVAGQYSRIMAITIIMVATITIMEVMRITTTDIMAEDIMVMVTGAIV